MKEIIFAGFGGQGVLTGGLIIAYMAANKDLNAVWMPAYGPTMRGGKANCVVKFAETSDERVGSPVMEQADILIAMNEPALDYLSFCKPGATVIANSSSVRSDYPFPEGTQVVFADCLGLARQVGNDKGQNLVAAAAAIKTCGLFDPDYAVATMCQFFEEKGKGKFNDLNVKAMQAGFDAV
ncbi:MAG: ferredoxin [Oscillospiraceae bacterium]|nr:ferredoxin [Oscillospiraceae bacterium]